MYVNWYTVGIDEKAKASASISYVCIGGDACLS